MSCLLVCSCPLFRTLSIPTHSVIHRKKVHTQTTPSPWFELKCWQVISYFIREISCHPLVSAFGAVIAVWTPASFAFVAQIFYWFSAEWMVVVLLLLFCVIISLGKPVAMMLPLVCSLACWFVCFFSFMIFVVCFRILFFSLVQFCSLLRGSSCRLCRLRFSMAQSNEIKCNTKVWGKKVICSLIDIYPVRRHHKWLAICW